MYEFPIIIIKIINLQLTGYTDLKEFLAGISISSTKVNL